MNQIIFRAVGGDILLDETDVFNWNIEGENTAMQVKIDTILFINN
jgi:hypothetical protein